jgi:hypothetical protein
MMRFILEGLSGKELWVQEEWGSESAIPLDDAQIEHSWLSRKYER